MIHPLAISTISETSNTTAYPFVTCLLPTENRARFISQAIVFFLQQDYPNKE